MELGRDVGGRLELHRPSSSGPACRLSRLRPGKASRRGLYLNAEPVRDPPRTPVVRPRCLSCRLQIGLISFPWQRGPLPQEMQGQ